MFPLASSSIGYQIGLASEPMTSISLRVPKNRHNMRR